MAKPLCLGLHQNEERHTEQRFHVAGMTYPVHSTTSFALLVFQQSGCGLRVNIKIRQGGSIPILAVAFAVSAIYWPTTGLSSWHFAFFALIFVGIISAFSQYNLPLMFYFPSLLLYWVVAPLVQSETGVTFFLGGSTLPEFNFQAFIFCFTHISGILLGLLASKSKRPYRILNAPKPLSLLSVSFVLFGLLTLILLLGTNSVLTVRTEQEAVESATRLLINLVKVVPAFLLVYYILSNRSRYSFGIRFIVLTALMMLLLIVSNPLNTPRFLSLFGVLIVLLALLIRHQRFRIIAWIAAFMPIYAVFILTITSLARSGFQEISFERIFISLQGLEFSSFAVFMDALDTDFESSNFLFSHLFVLFPRSIWLEKSGSIGIYVAENAGYTFTNVGLNSFFNAYADFGFVGLFLFSLLFGIASVKLNPIGQPPMFSNRRFVYGIVLSALVPMIVRGDLSTVVLGFTAASMAYEFVKLLTRYNFVWRRS